MIDLTPYVQSIQGKKFAVFGLGISGLPAACALQKAGADLVVWDDNTTHQDQAKAEGLTVQNLKDIDWAEIEVLILEPDIPHAFELHDIVALAQKNNIEVISDIELFHRARPSCKTIGITGTSGKSITAALLGHTLNYCGVSATVMGVSVFDKEENSDVVIFEIASYQMDLCPTFTPDISILLNITPKHLDKHGSMKDYVSAKGRILQGQGTALIAVDDDYTQSLFDRNFCEGQRRLIPVSMKSEIPEGYFVRQHQLIQNTQGEDKSRGALNNFPTLKGNHNYQNMLCAYGAAKEMGCEDAQIFEAFESFGGLAHRQFKLGQKGVVSFMNDSKATTPEATAKALGAYDNIYWIVGGRAAKGGIEGLDIFKDKVIKSYVIGEASAPFGLWMRYHNFDFEVCGVLDKAVQSAFDDAQKSQSASLILLSPACSSLDQFSSFEARGERFTEMVEAIINDGHLELEKESKA